MRKPLVSKRDARNSAVVTQLARQPFYNPIGQFSKKAKKRNDVALLDLLAAFPRLSELPKRFNVRSGVLLWETCWRRWGGMIWRDMWPIHMDITGRIRNCLYLLTSSLDQFRKLWRYTPTPTHMEAHACKMIIPNLAHVNRMSREVVLKKWLGLIRGSGPTTFMISLDKKKLIRKFEKIMY